jgi:hypothetical protein
MKIKWSQEFRQFEAEFSPGPNWALDQQALKEAGFKTSGPPDWVWATGKAGPLTTLRALKPVLGLTITSEALQNYNRLKEQEDRNAEVRKALKEAKKLAKREFDPKINWDDIKPEPIFYVRYTPPPPPSTLCSVCRTPVYYYECQDPIPLCLDCEFEEF